MKKRTIKNIAKVAAVLWGLVLWWYHFSEKIGHVKHDVQKELKDNLGKKEILKDQETNDIIELMSGKISQEHFDAMLARHGYINDTIKIDTLIQADEALYKTILEMQTKYTNPKISFGWSFRNYETWENEPDRARFNSVTNTIKSHQLDSIMIKFDNINKIEKINREHTWSLQWFSPDTWQKYLLNNWIAEISHSKQLKERGVIKMWIDCAIDYVQSWFNYERTYIMPWAEEYQAHGIYEPLLVQEFIETYKKYSDPTANATLWNLAKFNAWFFKEYKSNQKAYDYLKTLEKIWDADADFVLGNIFLEEYETHFGFRAWFWITSEVDTTMTETIFGEKHTPKKLFHECLVYYKKAYALGNLDAGYKLVDIAFNFRRGENLDIVLDVGNELIKNHI